MQAEKKWREIFSLSPGQVFACLADNKKAEALEGWT